MVFGAASTGSTSSHLSSSSKSLPWREWLEEDGAPVRARPALKSRDFLLILTVTLSLPVASCRGPRGAVESGAFTTWPAGSSKSRGDGIPERAGLGGSWSGVSSGTSRSSKAHKSVSVVSLARFPNAGRCRGGREDPSEDDGGLGVMKGGWGVIKAAGRTWPVRKVNPKFQKIPVASQAGERHRRVAILLQLHG
jgi:hypothetical protein